MMSGAAGFKSERTLVFYQLTDLRCFALYTTTFCRYGGDAIEIIPETLCGSYDIHSLLLLLHLTSHKHSGCDRVNLTEGVLR